MRNFYLLVHVPQSLPLLLYTLLHEPFSSYEDFRRVFREVTPAPQNFTITGASGSRSHGIVSEIAQCLRSRRLRRLLSTVLINFIQIYEQKDSKLRNLRNLNKYNNTQRYYGFKISQIQNFEISFAYTAKYITPTDKIRFKIEHCPTMCNFWHFNIFIWGQDSSSKKWIKLECPNIISNKTFEKIAIAVLPILAKR